MSRYEVLLRITDLKLVKVEADNSIQAISTAKEALANSTPTALRKGSTVELVSVERL